MPVKHLSHSSINTYMMCPASWKFRYADKIKMPVNAALPFGTAIHKAIQTYISAKVLHPDEARPLFELWPQCWRDTLAEQRQEVNWDKPQTYYDNLGLSMLKAPSIERAIEDIEPAFKSLMTMEKVPIIEQRIEFKIPSVPIPIIGYIDLITSDGVPIDLKTSARKWSRGKEHFELQPDFYLIGLAQDGFIVPDNKFRYYIFTKTKAPICQILETQRSWPQIFWTLNLIKEIWQAIEAGSFPPNTSGWKCQPKYCEYWELCRGR